MIFNFIINYYKMMINKNKQIDKLTAPEFLEGFTVQQMSIPKVQLSNKKAINSSSKKSLSPPKNSTGPQAVVVFSPNKDSKQNVTRAFSTSNPLSPGQKLNEKKVLKLMQGRQPQQLLAAPTLPNATKESLFNIQEDSFYRNLPSDSNTTVVKVRLHQRNIKNKLFQNKKSLETGSSQEFSPDKSNHVMMPKAVEVNPLSGEDFSQEFSQPHKMSSMEKRDSLNPPSHVTIYDKEQNNGNAPNGPTQFQIGFVNSMQITQKTDQDIDINRRSRERQSPKTKSYVPSRNQNRLSAVKEQEQFKTLDNNNNHQKTATSPRKIEAIILEDQEKQKPEIVFDSNEEKDVVIASRTPQNARFSNGFGNEFNQIEVRKKRTNLSSRKETEEKDDAEEFKSQSQISIVSSYIDGPSGERSPKNQIDAGLEPVIELQNSASPASPNIRKEYVIQPSFLISPAVKNRKLKHKNGPISTVPTEPNMKSSGKKKPTSPFSNQFSAQREETAQSKQEVLKDLENISTNERQSQILIHQLSQDTLPSNNTFKLPETHETQQTPVMQSSNLPQIEDDEYHQQTYESGKKASGSNSHNKAQQAEFYQVKYSRQNMTRETSKKQIPNNQDLGIKKLSKKHLGTQHSDERNKEKTSRSPERQTERQNSPKKSPLQSQMPSARHLRHPDGRPPEVEVPKNTQNIKMASHRMSPTSQTESQQMQIETIAPSKYGWAGNSGSQFSVMKSSFGLIDNSKNNLFDNKNNNKNSQASVRKVTNLMAGGAHKEIEDIHYQLQLLRQQNSGSQNSVGRKVKTLQQVALEIAQNEDKEVQRINQRHQSNGAQSQLQINIQNVDALDNPFINEKGGRSGFMTGAGSGQQSQERLVTYANMTIDQLEKEYQSQERRREQSIIQEMTQTKEVEKTEKSRDSPSPQKEKTLFPSKITYVALPLSQSNIIPHQHRSKSTLHTDNSRFALHIDISRNVSNAQIAIADINSRFKSSRASDQQLKKDSSQNALPHQISGYLPERDLKIQGTLDRNNQNMYKIHLKESKFSKEKTKMFNTKATINQIMKKKFQIEMNIENYNQMASRSSLHERSQIIQAKRLSLNVQQSQFAQFQIEQLARKKSGAPTHQGYVSVLSNESFKVEHDKNSQIAPFPDKLSNFDSTLKQGFGASPRYLGNEDVLSIRVKDEAEIQNQIADMSMQELTQKLTREMKQNSQNRQKNIRRRLASIPIYGEGSQSGQIIEAESSHYQGVGAQYFMPPAFGKKSPSFVSQNQTISGEKNVKIMLPQIGSRNESLQGTQNSNQFDSVKVGYEAVGVDARTISQSPNGMTQTSVSLTKPVQQEPFQKQQKSSFFGQQTKENGVMKFQIHEIMNPNLQNEAKERLQEKKKKMQAIRDFRAEMDEQVRKERILRNERLRIAKEKKLKLQEEPMKMTVNQAISDHFSQISVKMPVVFENNSFNQQNTKEMSPDSKEIHIKRIEQLTYHNQNLHRLLLRLEGELGNQHTAQGLKVIEFSDKLRKSQEAQLQAKRNQNINTLQVTQEISQFDNIAQLDSKKVNFQSTQEMESYIEELEMGGQQLSDEIQRITGSRPSLQQSRVQEQRNQKGQSPFVRNNNDKRPQPLQVGQDYYGQGDSDNNSSMKHHYTSFEMAEHGMVSPQGMSYIDPGTAIRDNRKEIFSPNNIDNQSNPYFLKQDLSKSSSPRNSPRRMNFDQVQNQHNQDIIIPEDNKIQTQDGGFNQAVSNHQQSSELWRQEQSNNSIVKKLVKGRNTLGTNNANNTLRDENLIKLTSIDAITNEQSQQESIQKGGITVHQSKMNNSTFDQMKFLPANAQSPVLPPSKRVNFQNAEEQAQLPHGVNSLENPIYQIKETAGKHSSFNRSYMNTDLPEEPGSSIKFRSSSYKEQQAKISQKLSQQPTPVVKIDNSKRNLIQKVGPNAGLPGSFSPTKAVETNPGTNDGHQFNLHDSEQRGQELQNLIHQVQIDRINHKRSSLPEIHARAIPQYSYSDVEEESAYIEEISSAKKDLETIEQQQMLHFRNKQRVLQTISAALAKSPTAMRVAVNLKTPKPSMALPSGVKVLQKMKQQEEIQRQFLSQISAKSLRPSMSVSRLKDPQSPQNQVHMLQILKHQHKENKKSRLRAKSVLATLGNVPITSRPTIGLNEYYALQQQQADPTASSRTLASNANNYQSNGSLITPLQRQFLLKQMPEKAKLIEEEHPRSRQVVSNLTTDTHHYRGISNISVQQKPRRVQLPQIAKRLRNKSQLQSYSHYTIEERIAQLQSPLKNEGYQNHKIEGY